MEFFRLIEKGKKTCVKENPAPCMSKCPLGIDIRDFIRKLNKGLTSAAYNTFALNAVMPGTVCHICDEPCRNICVRKGIDESVNLKALELYCWQQCSNKPKRTYYIREKNKSILICGGGPCELAAAVKLARRGYFVDIFTKEMRLGGKLWEIEDGILPKNVLEKDIDNIISEKYINVYYEEDSIAEDITKQYDAVLLAEEYKENITDSNIFVYTYNDNPLVDVNNGNILSYQIEEFIFKAESTGVYVYDAYTMERTAHSVIGYITVWVRYKLCAGGEYQILSAYYHRMRIKGEQDDE